MNIEKTIINKNLLSSSHINFLFGAGVNGNGFPQLSGFLETIDLLEKYLGRSISSFENDLNKLKKESDRKRVYNSFTKEFKSFEKKIDYESNSLLNLKKMIHSVYRIVQNSENRQRDMKQVNIYTLNYDNILENIMDSMGYMNNSISASNLGQNSKFLDLVAYDYKTFKYVPTFMISKLHGDIDKPIYPGVNKYETSLAPDYFEINFRMKEQLCQYNSILFVIGYSCNDDHINKILLDCMKHGLMIIWFKYNDDDKILEGCPKNQLHVICQPNAGSKVDTTLICSEMLEEINE